MSVEDRKASLALTEVKKKATAAEKERRKSLGLPDLTQLLFMISFAQILLVFLSLECSIPVILYALYYTRVLNNSIIKIIKSSNQLKRSNYLRY